MSHSDAGHSVVGASGDIVLSPMRRQNVPNLSILPRRRVVVALAALLAALGVALTSLTTGQAASSDDQVLANALQQARIATAKYAFNVQRAQDAGYMVITPNMDQMGFHFLNPNISGAFDVTKPPILVYVRKG